jgi:hypothetical protein
MGKGKKDHVAIRTCISCGAKRNRKDLMRLVLDDQGMVVWDRQGTGRGRGAYVCGNPSCLNRLQRGPRLERAFRRRGPVSVHRDLGGATEVVLPSN